MNMSIRKVLLSPDHSIFAYNTEREGMEYGELHFKDLNNKSHWEVIFFFKTKKKHTFLHYSKTSFHRMKYWKTYLILFGQMINLFITQYPMHN